MSVSDHDMVFASAGVQEFQSVGRYIRVREATSGLYLTIDGYAEVLRNKGEQIDTGRATTRVRVRSLVAQTVAIVSAENPQSDNRMSGTVAVTAIVEAGNDNQHLAKVTIVAGGSAQLALANSNRKFLRVSLLSTAVGHVLLGKSGILANQGGTLEEGMVDYIETTGVLFAFNPQATAVDVYVMEINKL